MVINGSNPAISSGSSIESTNNSKLPGTGGYNKMLKEKINLFLPQIIIQQPENSPEIGAVIMAKQI